MRPGTDPMSLVNDAIAAVGINIHKRDYLHFTLHEIILSYLLAGRQTSQNK